MKRTQIVWAVLLISVSLNSTSQIYRWVDEDGVTHYSDSTDRAPETHETVDGSLPPLHSMQRPSRVLTKVQAAAAGERQQRRRREHAAQTQRSRSNTNSSSSRCASYRNQLRKIQAQLRRGYREPRGNKLRDRRRELQARVNTQCR